MQLFPLDRYTLTASKSIFCYFYMFQYMHRLQITASGKGLPADALHTLRKSELGQRGTVTKGFVANLDNAFG